MLGQAVHDQVHELDLVRAQSFIHQESCKCLLGSLSIHTYQRAYEETEALRLRLGATDVLYIAETAFGEHALKFSQVGRVSALFMRSLWIAT